MQIVHCGVLWHKYLLQLIKNMVTPAIKHYVKRVIKRHKSAGPN